MSLEIVEGKTFSKRDTIRMDGKYFVGCKFLGCTIEFGGGNYSVDGCDFDSIIINVFGHARNTVEFLRNIRQYAPQFVLDLADVLDPENPSQAVH